MVFSYIVQKYLGTWLDEITIIPRLPTSNYCYLSDRRLHSDGTEIQQVFCITLITLLRESRTFRMLVLAIQRAINFPQRERVARIQDCIHENSNDIQRRVRRNIRTEGKLPVPHRTSTRALRHALACDGRFLHPLGYRADSSINYPPILFSFFFLTQSRSRFNQKKGF